MIYVYKSKYYLFRFLKWVQCLTTFVTLIVAVQANASESQEVKIYSGSTNLNILSAKKDVDFDIHVQYRDNRTKLAVRGDSDVRELLPEIGLYLETMISDKDRGCRERWNAWGGGAEIRDNSLRLKVSAKLEKWACEKIFGKIAKTRLIRETGTVHASIKPRISDGRLQLALVDFKISGLGDIAREFGVEDKLKKSLLDELKKFNGDSEKTSLPKKYTDLGFRYESVKLEHNRLSITAIGPNNLIELMAQLVK